MNLRRFSGKLSLLFVMLFCLSMDNYAFAGICSVDDSAGSGTYIESEHFTQAGDNFALESTKAGFNGSGYLRATSGSTSSTSGDPYEYEMNFPTAGTYYIWIRGHSNNSGGQNSVYYGVDGSPSGNYKAPQTTFWAWDHIRQNGDYSGTNPISITVSAGNHMFDVWSRESGYKFDAFFITKDVGVSIPQTASIPTIGSEIDPTDPNNDNCSVVVVGPLDIDDDLDGFTENQGDCNDTDINIHPFAPECPSGVGDSIDNNCDGTVDEGCYEDADNDGYSTQTDCNDLNPLINPGASEICTNSVDDNCDGLVNESCDIDGDGYTLNEGDCRDDRADIHPGAVEICGDLVDNDCSNGVDDGCDTTTIVDGGLIAQIPLILKAPVKPQVMLDISNDHQLYFTAYSDYDDLNQDGAPDGTYIHTVDYFGYFDSHKCYDYSSTDGRFVPINITDSDKYCDAATDGDWSGNFLNWAATARIDAVRKILYGGNRVIDNSSSDSPAYLTVLERSYLPNDAHSWVKYYSGSDIDKLTPFDAVNSQPFTSVSTSTVSMGTGAKTFATSYTSDKVRVGDQMVVVLTTDPAGHWMRGVVTGVSGTDVTINIGRSTGLGTFSLWTLSNMSRKGITLCNTTVGSGYSQNVTAPPLLRVAYGDYGLWTANERWQCRWDGEESRVNGNNIGMTGISSNNRTPIKGDVGLGEDDYDVRVEVCTSEALLGNEKCRQYPDGNYKPVGLLQTHGENDSLMFGLMTGSYTKNKSGGVLRKNISSITDEINSDSDGTFKTAPTAGTIIDTINKFRIYGYNHGTGTYNDAIASGGDNCLWGKSSFADGQCSNWGNPQSEIFLESLRYFAGASATSDFNVTGNDRISGLTAATWSDPLDSQTYCAPLNVINFNASMASYDADQLAGVSDLNTSDSAAELTDVVGTGENIHGSSWLVGDNGTDSNQLCTSKSISSLGAVEGICPEAPRLSGSYLLAGLAHHAFTEDIRSNLQGDQTVKTFGVALAPAVPRIDIPVPGTTDQEVSILPACRNTSFSPDANCAIVNFKPVNVDKASGTGLFFIQWEDSEQGGDYDQDMSGFLRYRIDTSTSPATLEVTTDVIAESTGYHMGFGYIVSGTENDGFHVHSGIEGFDYTDSSSVDGCSNCQVGDAATSGIYSITGTPSGQLEQPLYYAAKWGGYDKENTSLTFPTDTASWDADGDNVPDNYFYATNPSQLEVSLGKVFAELAEVNSSSAAVASNSTQLQTGTTIYQAKFNSADWSGEFMAVGLGKDTNGDVITTQTWDAESHFPAPASRNIYTLDPTATSAPYGIEFTWGTLTTDQQAFLNISIAGINDGLGNSRVDYFRGDRSVERQNGGNLRDRNRVLGDIINSDPIFVGTPDYGYAKLAGTEGSSYTSFRSGSSYETRTPTVYVGGNDGLLHAFNAATGVEEFAYVPNSIIPYMPRLTATNYGTQQNGHRYMVDGSPMPGDSYFGGGWHSVLLGSTGAGGKTIFALDITDPGTFSATDVLWEITPSTPGYQDLGYTMAQPTIGRLATGEWVAFISNGYHSANGKAVLYVADIATGLPLATAYGTIDVGVGDTTTPNGLGTPVPVDVNGDKIVDYVYAGDLQGNLWKFDFTDATASNWGVAYDDGTNPIPLFTASGPNGETQPISVRPAVGRHPTSGIMVWFGTGKFFDSNDNVLDPIVANRAVETFYGIQDKGVAITTTDRSELQDQSIIFEGQVEVPSSSPTEYYFDGREIRVLSQTSVDYSTDVGWYLDLVSPNSPDKRGERVVERPTLNNGKIIFVTLIPSDNPCESGGTSWLMEMDPFNGGRIADAIFDANGDGEIDDNDKLTIQDASGNDIVVSVSGLESEEGILQAPKILDDDSDINADGTGTQIKVFSGSTGNLMFQDEKGGDVSQKGRQSWRQIR